MSVLSKAPQTRAGSNVTTDTVLLVCGMAYAVLYVIANDVIAAAIYEGYSRRDQAVSELSASGAASQGFLRWTSLLFVALMVAYGTGVWRVAGAQPSLRWLGALIVAFGASGIAWLAFPMSDRDDIAAGTNTAGNDAGHLIMAALSVAMIVACLVLGAVAIRGWFRWYSLVSIVVILATGAYGGQMVTKLENGEGTAWMGAAERASVYGFYLWLALLAAILLRAVHRQEHP